jgi:hypothetical protein
MGAFRKGYVDEQLVMAFIAALVQQEMIDPSSIVNAVNYVRDLKIGDSWANGDLMVSAFAGQECSRLVKMPGLTLESCDADS